jgi:hypothetical protein
VERPLDRWGYQAGYALSNTLSMINSCLLARRHTPIQRSIDAGKHGRIIGGKTQVLFHEAKSKLNCVFRWNATMDRSGTWWPPIPGHVVHPIWGMPNTFCVKSERMVDRNLNRWMVPNGIARGWSNAGKSQQSVTDLLFHPYWESAFSQVSICTRKCVSFLSAKLGFPQIS